MIRLILGIPFLFCIIFYFNSCDILRDSPFEVISWSPGEGFHSDPGELAVSLTFSHDPDRTSVERRFLLTGNDKQIAGTFLWEGREMIFAPRAPLEINTDYRLYLEKEARDVKGLSMETVFEREFSTRPDNTYPEILSCFPDMYAQSGDVRTEVRLEYSAPVTLETVYDNVSFKPFKDGVWRLEDDGMISVFSPLEPWSENIRYEINVTTSLTADNGMNLRNGFLSVFTVSAYHEIPYLIGADRITSNNDIIRLNPSTGEYSHNGENSGWEKDDRLRLLFSEPVNGLSVKNCLAAEDAPYLVMETVPGLKDEFIFRFETIPAHESRFTFRLKKGFKNSRGDESEEEYIFRIFADGIFSKPPALAGIRMPMAPDNENDKELVSYGIESLFENFPVKDEINYPSGENVNTWIELYFDAAQGARVEPFSVMELFRIETTNRVLDFSARNIKTENFSVSEAAAGWENYQRMEITGILTNYINYGIVNFLIERGLADSYGNRNEKSFRISVVK
ncbi:MAG: Ig-like domain-containing protein [Treponema sp.]|jgi:hypothetical protein|nr:Ig-like domain-containing protein [Treponema sp.]